MKKVRYIKGVTLDQAFSVLGEITKVLAGGADILRAMKDDASAHIVAKYPISCC